MTRFHGSRRIIPICLALTAAAWSAQGRAGFAQAPENPRIGDFWRFLMNDGVVPGSRGETLSCTVPRVVARDGVDDLFAGLMEEDPCYTAATLGRHPGDSACTDFSGFVCAPPGNYERRKQEHDDAFGATMTDERIFRDLSIDLWLHRNSENAARDYRLENGRALRPPLDLLEGVPRPLSNYTSEAIRALRVAGNEEEATRREGIRYRIFSPDGTITQGADYERCHSGALDSTSAGCREAIRTYLANSEKQRLEIRLGFGAEELPQGMSVPQEVRRKVSRAAERLREVRGQFAGIKASFRRMLQGATHIPEPQRQLALRIVDDVEMVPPDEYYSSEAGLSAWSSMCTHGGLNAAHDDEIGFHAGEGDDRRFHRHGVIICPPTLLNASTDWLEGVISHEIGHALSPGALDRLRQRYFTHGYLNDSRVPEEEREFYRRLAGGQDQSGIALTEGLAQSLYGGFPVRYERSGQGWELVRPQESGPDGWYETVGGCMEAFSKCTHLEDFDSEGRPFRRPVTNPDRCNDCFTLEHGMMDEINADEVSAEVTAIRLAEQTRNMEPSERSGFARARLRSIYDHFCYGGDRNPNGHPSGPARLARILGNSPGLRRVLGCGATQESHYSMPCRSGFVRRPGTPRLSCYPQDPGERYEHILSCPVR